MAPSLLPRLRAASYSEFVALIEQENAPPGGIDTIDEWVEHGVINSSAVVLDLACSTGFSGREVSRRTRCCTVTGLDLVPIALTTATRMSRRSSAERPKYVCGDAASLPFGGQQFSHVLAGSCVGFIAERQSALREVKRVLRRGGSSCVASFCYCDEPPAALLDEVETAIGYRPDRSRDLEYWLRFFGSEFTLSYLRPARLAVMADAEVEPWVASLVRCSEIAREDNEIAEVVHERLLQIQRCLNRHRLYQGAATMVWQLSGDG